MFEAREVPSLDVAELAPYRTLRRPMEHQKQGIFVAEGEKVVRRLLNSGLAVISMLMTSGWFSKLFPTGTELPCQVFLADKKLVETIVGYNLHQGIMAVGSIPPERPFDETIRSLPQPHLLVALDGIASAENVGVIVRNAAAFGAQAILAGETSSSPYLRRAVRNSMGAVFRLPVVSSSNIVEDLKALREKRVSVIAAHPRSSRSIYVEDLTGNLCLVLGNEEHGVSGPVLETCTHQISIPMLNETDSLNVSSACAVFLSEIQRRRKD